MTTGTFTYIDPSSVLASTSGSVKPWNKVDVHKTSFRTMDCERTVTNIRLECGVSAVSLDSTGFALVNHPVREEYFNDDSAVRGGYYADVEILLRGNLPGIKKITIFDHTIRRRETTSPRQPVRLVHVDQTPAAAEARVRRHISDEKEALELLKGRYQLINVWRPIGHNASDFPLAVLDWRSTLPQDFVKVDLMYPKQSETSSTEVLADKESIDSIEGYERRGEQYVLTPNDEQKWCYAKDMTPDEALLIKCFDSRGQYEPCGIVGVASSAPHTAFKDPETPSDAKPRQSIEVRCLVFYE
ncbi:hypothetical protein BDV27DRAFT_165943 [Aspergillus caelatus]|uniref:Methyltransferase n=1 Tax=Aspergillus caelatus TaxID=61420 RepID=A0A5N6ZZJ7_9EURO|nr:uncharacterized protein BDV27DRAFT_165943 [Aspergillus caelatus]KAE8362748.1 hypothetical protein BDV27DRAFT_165943 [Aspergillus caelatus]